MALYFWVYNDLYCLSSLSIVTAQAMVWASSNASIWCWMHWIIVKLAITWIVCVWRQMSRSLRVAHLATMVRWNWFSKEKRSAMNANRNQRKRHFRAAPFETRHQSRFIALSGPSICSSEYTKSMFSFLFHVNNAFSIRIVNCSVNTMKMKMSRPIQKIQKL